MQFVININSNVGHILALSATVGLLAACGGGGDGPSGDLASTSDTTASTETRSQASAVQNNAAQASGSLRLVSSSSAGQAAVQGASGCGISADGTVVAFTSASSNLVAGDTNQRDDVFVKNLNTGVTTRATTGAPGISGGTCAGLSANGRYVVFTANTPVPTPDPIYQSASELALFVRDLSTGSVSRVSPPLASQTLTAGFAFQAISDNGQRVAFLAQPTTRYLGGYLIVSDGPARPLVYDVASGSLRDLSGSINLVTDQDLSTLTLSSDGKKLAFATLVNQPRAGDTNGRGDVFVLDLATDALSLASSTSASTVFGFRNNDSQLLFFAGALSTPGADGVFARTLSTGALSLLVPQRPGFALTEFDAVFDGLSFSADAKSVAFVRSLGNRNESFVRRLNTGQEQRLAVTATGVVGNGFSNFALIAADGRSALLNSSSTNLVTLPRGTQPFQVYVKTLTTAP
jgi:Tol biopolymer transport system component